MDSIFPCIRWQILDFMKKGGGGVVTSCESVWSVGGGAVLHQKIWTMMDFERHSQHFVLLIVGLATSSTSHLEPPLILWL